jgi:acetyl esterase/lipase
VSAGGNLAASVAFRFNQLLAGSQDDTKCKPGVVAGVLLCTPWLLHHDAYPFHLLESREVASPIQNADAPLLPKHRVELFTRILKVQEPANELFNAGGATKGLTGMPKTAFIVAGRDPFRDEALLYGEELSRNG